jgi:hypothetical protein
MAQETIALFHFKLSRVGEDTNPGGVPWAVSPPPTFNATMRQFEMHLKIFLPGRCLNFTLD